MKRQWTQTLRSWGVGRGRARLMRLALVGASSIATPASADEAPAAPPADESTRSPPLEVERDAAGAAIRRAVLTGNHERARARIGELRTDGLSASERAALEELSSINEDWSTSGIPAPAGGTWTPMPDPNVDWEAAFSATRQLLAKGWYVEAQARFARLVAATSVETDAARAEALRLVAQDAPHIAKPTRAVSTIVPAEVLTERPENPPVRTTTHWYGWQTLIADGVAIPMLFVVPPLSLGIYLVAPPVVHLFNGRPLVALGDLAVRAGAPIALGAIAGAGGAAACAIGSGGGVHPYCVSFPMLFGAAVGTVFAMVIDAAVLAREATREPAAASRNDAYRPRRSVSLLPTFTLDRENAASVGLVGSF